MKEIAYNKEGVNILKVKISYDKLFVLLRHRGLKITNVCKEAGLSPNVGSNISRDESVNLKSLACIALYLGVTLNDIVDIFNEE